MISTKTVKRKYFNETIVHLVCHALLEIFFAFFPPNETSKYKSLKKNEQNKTIVVKADKKKVH